MSAYAEGSIAGVNITNAGRACKVVIQDGDEFFSEFVGSVRRAADRTPYVQLLNPGTKGAQFGVLIEYMPMSVFASIKSAIDAALAAQSPFNVTLSDDVHSINVSVMPDYSAGQFPTYPAGRLNGFYLKDVTMRFISTA